MGVAPLAVLAVWLVSSRTKGTEGGAILYRDRDGTSPTRNCRMGNLEQLRENGIDARDPCRTRGRDNLGDAAH